MLKRKWLLTLAIMAVLWMPGWLVVVYGDAPAQTVDQLQVVSVQELDLMAGPARTSAYLAPDGEHFAHLDRQVICIYTIAGEQQRCVSLEDLNIRRLDEESVRWSPDSRYLAMTEEFFRTLNEPDIWILDTTTGALSNLTDDGVNRIDLKDMNWDALDLLPTWVGGGAGWAPWLKQDDSARLLFLRYMRTDEVTSPPAIFAINPDGSGLEMVGEIESNEVFPVSAIDWSPDGTMLAYNVWAREQESDQGTWISDGDGRRPRQLLQAQRIFELPTNIEFSPDGRYLLVYLEGIIGQSRVDAVPENSGTRALSVETGEMVLLNSEHFVWFAGWAPEGAGVAYLVRDQLNPDVSGLYLAAEPGAPGRMVLPGTYAPPTSRNRQAIIWTANNTILLSKSPAPGIVIVRLG